MNFFAELKRRNVFRAGAFYAACAWLLVQVATQVFPFFHISEWVVRWIIVAAVIGFPVWLALAWFYEWTAHGLQRESDSPTPLSPSSRASRRSVDRWIVVMLAAAVVLLLADRFLFRDQSAKAATAPEKSIAVLPFDNLSRDPDNAYFVEGIQDEILTRLSKIADLKVIARSSTLRFQNKGDLPQIAQQLGVAHLLEGSVQKVSDRVRVNVQLIKAANEAHLWAEVYDRKLTDIFAVESEIAKTIAESLQAKLSGSENNAIAKRPTENPEAHELYLKGRYFWNRRNAENLKNAADYFQQAIAKDPKYALAHAGLADCHVLLPAYPGLGNTPRDEWPKALQAARNAVELDDTLAEGHTSLARVLASTLQLSAATSEFRRAIDLNPNYATAHQWFGECLQSQGQLEEALAEIKRAQELDPLSLVISALYGFALDTVGKSEDAIAQLRKTIEIDSNFENAHGMLGVVLQHNGRLKEAIAEYEKNISLHEDAISLSQLAGAYFLAGRKEEAQQLWDKLRALSDRQYTPAYSMAVVQSSFGNKDQAIHFLEKSYEDHAPFDSNDLGWILVDHRLDSLRDDPRFKRLVARIFSSEAR